MLKGVPLNSCLDGMGSRISWDMAAGSGTPK